MRDPIIQQAKRAIHDYSSVPPAPLAQMVALISWVTLLFQLLHALYSSASVRTQSMENGHGGWLSSEKMVEAAASSRGIDKVKENGGKVKEPMLRSGA